MASVRQALLILLLLSSGLNMSSAQFEEIENRPLDGHKLLQGQSFRIECRSITNQDLAIRLACPLAEYATGGLASTSCFENCGRPLCDQPNLNDCSKTLPELLVANCSRSVKQISLTWQEISVVYMFNLANLRHSGSYICQFKNLRSSSYIIVDPIITTSTSSTTSTTSTSTTSTTSSTASSTTSTPTTTKSTVSTSSRAGVSTMSATATSSTVSMETKSKPMTAEATSTTKTSLLTESSSTEKTYTLPPRTQPTSTRAPSEPTTSNELILNPAGWFYASIVGTLTGADVILICLIIFIAAAWLIGFLCIRSQVLQVLSKKGTPTSRCCSVVLCLCQKHQPQRKYHQGPQTVNGGLRDFAERERRLGAVRLTAMSSRPTAASANSVSSGQVYAEPDGVSYYSPDGGDGVLQHPLVLAGGVINGADEYYRLQQDFDDPLSRGGYGTNPRSTFFPRDQTGRHSFQSARPAARHRPSIPQQMLLDAEETDAEAEAAADLVAAAVDPVITREDFRRQMEEQRREIASLRQQLRNSQLQLNQRSSAAAAAKQPQQAAQQQHQHQQQQQQQQQSPTSDDYDQLSRVAAADTIPPSPPPPPPPQQQQKQSVSQSLTDDSDLPPLPPPPIVDEADALVANELENRRGSLGQAYGTGQRY